MLDGMIMSDQVYRYFSVFTPWLQLAQKVLFSSTRNCENDLNGISPRVEIHRLLPSHYITHLHVILRNCIVSPHIAVLCDLLCNSLTLHTSGCSAAGCGGIRVLGGVVVYRTPVRLCFTLSSQTSYSFTYRYPHLIIFIWYRTRHGFPFVIRSSGCRRSCRLWACTRVRVVGDCVLPFDTASLGVWMHLAVLVYPVINHHCCHQVSHPPPASITCTLHPNGEYSLPSSDISDPWSPIIPQRCQQYSAGTWLIPRVFRYNVFRYWLERDSLRIFPVRF